MEQIVSKVVELAPYLAATCFISNATISLDNLKELPSFFRPLELPKPAVVEERQAPIEPIKLLGPLSPEGPSSPKSVKGAKNAENEDEDLFGSEDDEQKVWSWCL